MEILNINEVETILENSLYFKNNGCKFVQCIIDYSLSDVKNKKVVSF